MENKNITDAVKDAHAKLLEAKAELTKAELFVTRAHENVVWTQKAHREAKEAQDSAYSTFKQASGDWMIGQLAPDDLPF